MTRHCPQSTWAGQAGEPRCHPDCRCGLGLGFGFAFALGGAGSGKASGRSSSLGGWGLVCPGVFFRLVGGGMASRSSSSPGSAWGLASGLGERRGRRTAAPGTGSARIAPSTSTPSMIVEEGRFLRRR